MTTKYSLFVKGRLVLVFPSPGVPLTLTQKGPEGHPPTDEPGAQT